MNFVLRLCFGLFVGLLGTLLLVDDVRCLGLVVKFLLRYFGCGFCVIDDKFRDLACVLCLFGFVVGLLFLCWFMVE